MKSKTKQLLMLLMFLCPSVALAQDVIVKKDGSTIISKVLEIGIFEVKYKDFSNLQGPTYGIAKSDVMRINYENGEEESFKSPRKGQPNFFFIKLGGGASSIVGRHADTDLKFACTEGLFYDIGLSSNFWPNMQMGG